MKKKEFDEIVNPYYNRNRSKDIASAADKKRKTYTKNKVMTELDKGCLSPEEIMYADGLYFGFRDGAKWADLHPSMGLIKAIMYIHYGSNLNDREVERIYKQFLD